MNFVLRSKLINNNKNEVMKANNKAMLYEAVSEFIQLHAFDHLLDNELAQFKNVLNQWLVEDDANEAHFLTEKLVAYLSKVNFFVESISPAAIQLWFYALSYNEIPFVNTMGSTAIDSSELINY